MSDELLSAAGTGDLDTVRSLLDHGADANTADREEKTALMYAVEAGEIEMVRLLLDHGADPAGEQIIYGGTILTALSMAAGGGCLEIVNLLLARGARPDSMYDPDLEGDYSLPLHVAASGGHVAVVRRLLECTPWDEGAVRAAAHACQPEMLELLLGCGKQCRQEMLDQSLGQAAPRGFYMNTRQILATANLLLDHGAELRVAGKTADELILWVVDQGRPEVVLLLLTRGVASHPLWTAASTGEASLVEHLLATQKYTPFERNYALYLAARAGPPHDPNQVRETVRLLLESGADPIRLPSGHNEGPLASAIIWGFPSTALLLQERGADLNVRDEQGKTALMRLMTRLPPDAGALDRLLAHGADINAGDGRTALTEAARLGQKETVQLLLQRGADPNHWGFDPIRNRPGYSALEMALAGKRIPSLVQMLRDAGAKE